MRESDDVNVEDLDDLWPPFAAVRPRHARRPRSRPERNAPLSSNEIVRTALALADAHGAEAINMRRIAKELGVGTMSLYWHVGNKEHLLDLMLDAVAGEDQGAKPSGNWQEDLADIARTERASLLRHRWKLDVTAGRPPLGPNGLLHIERSLASLDNLDIEPRIALHILTTVMTYVTGSVLNELSEINVEQQQAKAGLTEGEIKTRMSDWTANLHRSGRFPRLLRIFNADVDPDAAGTRDERFEFGLRCVLDGITRWLTRKRPAHDQLTPSARVITSPGPAPGHHARLRPSTS
jgi:AcrR family transcriptional regulator